MTFQVDTHRMGVNITSPAGASLAGLTHDALSVYHANSEVYGQGEPAGSLYIVEFGCVRVGRFTSDGRRYVVGFCFAGDVFGWESDVVHDFFAEAVEISGIRAVRPGRANEAPARLLPLMLKSLRRFEQHLIVLRGTRVDERLAAFLCQLSERQDGESLVQLPMPRSDIGDYLGVSLETVSRILRRFKDRGIISTPDTHSVEILDWQRLQNLCSA